MQKPKTILQPASRAALRCGQASARPSGFTVVELVAVMVLIGILGAFAAPRFFQRSSFDALSFTDQTRAIVRYGQKVAIAQNRNVFVRLNGSSVALCFDAGCASHVIPMVRSNSDNPATKANCNDVAWVCEGVPSGLAYTSGVSSFYFDATGKPFASGDVEGTLVSTFARLSIVIVITVDGSSRTVTVEPETGYVY